MFMYPHLKIITSILSVIVFSFLSCEASAAPYTDKTFGIDSSDIVQSVSTLKVLQALGDAKDLTSSTGRQTVYMEGRSVPGDGGQGIFRWDGSDLSAKITEDPQKGLYVAPNLDPTGSSGAWVRQYQYITPQMFGAGRWGTSDDTIAMQATLNFGGDIRILQGDIVQVSDQMMIISNTTISGGGTIKARHSGTIFRASHQINIHVLDIRLDGNSTAGTGVFFDNCMRCGIENVEIRNIADIGAAYAGGILFSGCKDVYLKRCRLYNISDGNPNARAIAFSSSTDCIGYDIFIDGAGKGLSLYNAQNCTITNVVAKNLLDNGIYINGESKNLLLSSMTFDFVEEGVVLNSSFKDANINISDIFIISPSNKAISLRTGGGYTLSDVNIVNAPIAIGQSDNFSGVTDVVFRNITCRGNKARPISLSASDNNIRFYGLEIYGSKDSIAINIPESCNDIYFFNPKIFDSSKTAKIAIRYLSDGKSEYTGGVYNIVTDIPTPVITATDGSHKNIIVFGENTINKKISILSHSGNDEEATIQLGTRNSSVDKNEVVSRISMYTADTSGKGARDFFSLFATSVSSLGSEYKVELKVEGEDGVCITSDGATVKLPTSTNGLPSGSLWNNGGVVSIVP